MYAPIVGLIAGVVCVGAAVEVEEGLEELDAAFVVVLEVEEREIEVVGIIVKDVRVLELEACEPLLVVGTYDEVLSLSDEVDMRSMEKN